VSAPGLPSRPPVPPVIAQRWHELGVVLVGR
jgi:hypothetical protein